MKRTMYALILALLFIVLITRPSNAATLPVVTFRGYDGELEDLVQGYLVDDTVNLWLTPGLITWQTYRRQAPTYSVSRAIWQAPGVMTASAEYNRVDLSDVAGGIALMSPSDINRLVYIRRHGGEWIPTRVADVSNRLHTYFHVVQVNSGIELSYELAESMGVLEHRTPGGGIGMMIEICAAYHTSSCVGTPMDYREWFLETVDFE